MGIISSAQRYKKQKKCENPELRIICLLRESIKTYRIKDMLEIYNITAKSLIVTNFLKIKKGIAAKVVKNKKAIKNDINVVNDLSVDVTHSISLITMYLNNRRMAIAIKM